MQLLTIISFYFGAKRLWSEGIRRITVVHSSQLSLSVNLRKRNQTLSGRGGVAWSLRKLTTSFVSRNSYTFIFSHWIFKCIQAIRPRQIVFRPTTTPFTSGVSYETHSLSHRVGFCYWDTCQLRLCVSKTISSLPHSPRQLFYGVMIAWTYVDRPL